MCSFSHFPFFAAAQVLHLHLFLCVNPLDEKYGSPLRLKISKNLSFYCISWTIFQSVNLLAKKIRWFIFSSSWTSWYSYLLSFKHLKAHFKFHGPIKIYYWGLIQSSYITSSFNSCTISRWVHDKFDSSSLTFTRFIIFVFFLEGQSRFPWCWWKNTYNFKTSMYAAIQKPSHSLPVDHPQCCSYFNRLYIRNPEFENKFQRSYRRWDPNCRLKGGYWTTSWILARCWNSWNILCISVPRFWTSFSEKNLVVLEENGIYMGKYVYLCNGSCFCSPLL